MLENEATIRFEFKPDRTDEGDDAVRYDGSNIVGEKKSLAKTDTS